MLLTTLKDFSTCTFLFQDDCGGLEVESPVRNLVFSDPVTADSPTQRTPGVFLPANPMPGAVVFNIGDFLMRWSNDSLKSTLHRVRAPPPLADDTDMTRERFSIPYVSLPVEMVMADNPQFCGANKKMTIDVLPGSYSESVPKKYGPITAGEYVNMRLNATYADGVQKLKVNKLVY